MNKEEKTIVRNETRLKIQEKTMKNNLMSEVGDSYTRIQSKMANRMFGKFINGRETYIAAQSSMSSETIR